MFPDIEIATTVRLDSSPMWFKKYLPMETLSNPIFNTKLISKLLQLCVYYITMLFKKWKLLFPVLAPTSAPKEIKVASNGPRRILVTWKVTVDTKMAEC